jgi:cytochrome c biogenesis protein ResB
MKKIGEFVLKIIRLFKGVKLSAVVIALLILIYFLGLVLPQKWMFLSEEHYNQWRDKNVLNTLIDLIGFTDIYLSPVTMTLLTIFFVNLLVVIINRVPVILKRAYLMGESPSFSVNDLKKKNAKGISPGTKDTEIIAGIKTFFRKRRWSVIEGRESNTLIAIKNRFSPIGFLLFHISFLLCLIGGLLITYTRFSGELALTEGQEFRGDIKQFHNIINDAKVLQKLPSLSLLLDKVEPKYENDIPTELLVKLKINYEGNMRNEMIRVNEPVHRGPMSIIAQSLGVSPLFIVQGPGGKELEGAYVTLNVLGGEEDAFQFDTDRSVKFRVKFYPDHIVEDGVDRTRSIELKNPAIHLVVEKEGEVINEGTIMQGEYMDLGTHTKIGFKEIRYWAKFMIVREYGKMPLVAGFLFASLGLVMRLVFYQRRIRIAIEYAGNKPIIYIDGRSEYFRHSFKDELEMNVNDLERFMAAPR